ncbi:hypothetical protein BG011_005496 [Mortierella polycephala]|uniref:Transmembrane protein 198 n=1 Tax=Mortierella polycephala TaxID=41804 RepID=A0A9P6U095_9FUNG|nr:hypothetical protein BG011_005496 [Mortierella polycephala]
MTIGCALADSRSTWTNRTVTPIGDNNSVIQDVGQHVKLSTQNWALGVALILFGLLEVLFGFKFIRLTLFVTGFMSWAIAAMIIMVAFRWDLVYTTFMPQHYYLWVWLLAGLTGAILSFRYWDVGVTFAGAFGGFALAMGIIAAANLAIANAGRYVLLGIFILGGAAFATFFERTFIIVATSLGGAYIFMYGVDEFVQVGYREMIVIFDFTGKTLTYHPNRYVYLMLGCSFVLAAMGILWELWHHKTPLFMDRKALFRIYGRPFGKRPKNLVGQRIHHHLRTQSELYAYIVSCACLHRRDVDDVLYYGDNCVEHPLPAPVPVPASVPDSSEEPTITPPGTEYPIATDEEHDEKEFKDITAPLTDEPPMKTAPIQEPEDSNLTPATDLQEKQSSSIDTAEQRDASESAPATEQDPDIRYSITTTTYTFTPPTLVPSHSTSSGSHDVAEDRPGRTQHADARTMNLLHLVTDDTSPGNTIPTGFAPMDYRSRMAMFSSPMWPSPTALPERAAAVNTHLFELSESTQGAHEPQGSEESEVFPNGVEGEAPAVHNHSLATDANK